ncbi:MAG: Rieske (2Fe-2S) protein [Synechococcales bacterium]|nr:Rieske (2Fe-2S) protein [Synechococcales bacterium]
MRRRKFLQRLGITGFWASLWTSLLSALTAVLPASLLPIGLGGCDRALNTKGLVGKVAELDEQGEIYVEYFTDRPLLLVRNPQQKEQLVAVNPTCSHQGCIVKWQADKTAFVCPCHGATFGLQGQVLQGPAEQPLQTFQPRIEGDRIFVS